MAIAMKSSLNAKLKIIAAVAVIAGGFALSLFNSWEMGGETWGYWMYARIFLENGTFSVKSPLYSLYLSGFLWLGYPHAVTAEYVVTTTIVIAGLVTLFRPHLGLGLSVFAGLLWLPFLQVAEPLNQILAIGLICWALVLRRSATTRLHASYSYALMIAAFSLRAPFGIFLILFAASDLLLLRKQKGLGSALKTLQPRFSDWPVGVLLLLMVWFAMAQSPLPWNNIYFSSTKYFPNPGKSQLHGTTSQSYNWDYIEMKYGTFTDKDFYFTNQEAFKGARNTFEQFTANPKLFLQITYGKIRKTIGSLLLLISMRFPWGDIPYGIKLLCYALNVLTLALIVYGAFRMVYQLPEKESANMALFLVGNLIIVASATAGAPGPRYLTPFIPVLICSAGWFGKIMGDVSGKTMLWFRTACSFQNNRSHPFSKRCSLCTALLLILFSNGISEWSHVTKAFAGQLDRGEFRVMESGPYSTKASFHSLRELTRNCRGVLSLEHTFIGGFTNIPLSMIYDVYEIPPFGNYGEAAYTGLRPERIDCVLESHNLATVVGYATNVQIRYQHYIKPYIEHLQRLGARMYEIPHYGRAIILTNQPVAQASMNIQTNALR